MFECECVCVCAMLVYVHFSRVRIQLIEIVYLLDLYIYGDEAFRNEEHGWHVDCGATNGRFSVR